jgi:hypothetical protein
MGVDEVASSCRRAVEVLALYPLDLPFCALYVLDADSRHARRATLSTPMPDEWFPEALSLPPPPSRDPWKLAAL